MRLSHLLARRIVISDYIAPSEVIDCLLLSESWCNRGVVGGGELLAASSGNRLQIDVIERRQTTNAQR